MKRAALLFVSALAVALPAPARAWIQTTTCGGESAACEDGETPQPTHWETPCVAFHLNQNGTSDIPNLEDVIKIAQDAIETWNIPQKSSLVAHYSGLTDETRVGFNPYTDRNANIIVFRDDGWNESRAIMALTTVTQNKRTGEIYDADIEINTAQWKFGIVGRDGNDVVDLRNTLTHEIGHALGLAHSDVSTATMAAYASAGDTSLITLDDDDIDALSAIYPRYALTCEFSDGFFDAPPFAMDERPPADGCSAAPAAAQKMPGFIIFAAIIAALSFFARRKFANSAKS